VLWRPLCLLSPFPSQLERERSEVQALDTELQDVRGQIAAALSGQSTSSAANAQRQLATSREALEASKTRCARLQVGGTVTLNSLLSLSLSGLWVGSGSSASVTP
jgi:hypothetical protein